MHGSGKPQEATLNGSAINGSFQKLFQNMDGVPVQCLTVSLLARAMELTNTSAEAVPLQMKNEEKTVAEFNVPEARRACTGPLLLPPLLDTIVQQQ